VRRIVRLLTTGGTIASRRGAAGVLATITAAELVSHFGEMAGIEVKVEEVFLIGSYRLQMTDLLHLAQRVEAALADDEVAGVVVTHGTDTMEESAYFVDLFHKAAQQPVVFTGAQRAFDAPDPDGLRNLTDAVRLAASPDARGLGVAVAMSGRAYTARDATKVHTMDLAAFDAPGRGPCVEMFGEQSIVLSARQPRPAFELAAVATLPRVDIVPLYVGADGTFIKAACAAGAAGVVLQAFGTGNANPSVLTAVQSAIAEDVLVVVASRCPAGRVQPLYGAGGGKDLAEAGAAFAGSLRPVKARLLLTAALSTTASPHEALQAMTPHLVGC
jgi:L-asparaginase